MQDQPTYLFFDDRLIGGFLPQPKCLPNSKQRHLPLGVEVTTMCTGEPVRNSSNICCHNAVVVSMLTFQLSTFGPDMFQVSVAACRIAQGST